MSPFLSSLAVQSYCFRGFTDPRDVIRLVRECGLGAIELCGRHADFTKPEEFADLAKAYRDGGVEVVSIGVCHLKGGGREMKPFFECARRAGLRHMSVNFQPADLARGAPAAEKLAGEHGVRLGIHNHGGRHWLGSSQMLEHVLSLSGDRVGLCLDTAWALDSGEDPVAMVGKFGKRIHAVHFKDYEFDRARKPKDTVLGEGNLKLKELLAALGAAGFDGCAILEYEGDVNDPAPALKRCVEVLRAAA
jgi:sugar phosphate isomerase/epimerase